MEPHKTTTTSSSTTTSSAASLPLKDRVAIITGASRGRGKEIATHLTTLGARVIINYTSPSSQPLAETLESQLNSATPTTTRAAYFQADVTDPTQVHSLFNFAEQTFQTQPHIVVTSAGVLDSKYSKYPTVYDTAVEDFDRNFAVNVRGTFPCVKEAAKRVKRGVGGRIVTVSSSMVAALRPGYGAYAASKAAVEAMTKVVAKELKGTGITVNCVAPGAIETEMFFEGKSEEVVKKVIDENPFGRLGRVEDVVPLVGFLVGDSGEWVNGQIIRINGGYV